MNNTSSELKEHGPAGLSVVKVNVTFPIDMSPALGVYIAFKLFGSSKLPEPLVDHVADVADPPIVPLNGISSSEHTVASTPADTVTVSFRVTST